MLRHLAMLAGVLTLASCVTPYPDLTQSRSPCRSEPGGWCGFVRDIAAESYGYAMLSSNAYLDEDTYTALPAAFERREAAENDKSGLAYAVFDRFAMQPDGSRGKLAARVIAFRGTEFGSAKDVLVGSFGENQITGARVIYLAERAELDRAGLDDVPIEVTGHSLGGALSTQLSIDNPGVRAFIFNSSPLFDGDPMVNDADRLAISERGEFLRVLSRYKATPASDALVLNCSPSSSSAGKHSIRGLADCLTWIAAYSDAEAARLIAPNGITKPEVECGAADKVHPGVLTVANNPPCIHRPREVSKK